MGTTYSVCVFRDKDSGRGCGCDCDLGGGGARSVDLLESPRFLTPRTARSRQSGSPCSPTRAKSSSRLTTPRLPPVVERADSSNVKKLNDTLDGVLEALRDLQRENARLSCANLDLQRDVFSLSASMREQGVRELSGDQLEMRTIEHVDLALSEDNSLGSLQPAASPPTPRSTMEDDQPSRVAHSLSEWWTDSELAVTAQVTTLPQEMLISSSPKSSKRRRTDRTCDEDEATGSYTLEDSTPSTPRPRHEAPSTSYETSNEEEEQSTRPPSTLNAAFSATND